MTKKKIFIKIFGGTEETFETHKKLNDPFVKDVFQAMDEYGKYCAEQAWQNREDLFFNDFEYWWDEFNKT
jgi:hypothetical protein